MKVWITAYALTKGILEGKGDIETSSPRMICMEKSGHFKDMALPYFRGEGKDWHRTEESAIKEANRLVAAKISSLESQLDRLRTLKF